MQAAWFKSVETIGPFSSVILLETNPVVPPYFSLSRWSWRSSSSAVSLISVLSTFVNVLQADQLIELLNSKAETNWSLALDTVLTVLDCDEVSETSCRCHVGWYTQWQYFKLVTYYIWNKRPPRFLFSASKLFRLEAKWRLEWSQVLFLATWNMPHTVLASQVNPFFLCFYRRS